MELKTVEIEGETYAVVQDGKPVYENEGKDVPFDAPHAMSKIQALGTEAKQHREAKEEAEAKLKAYDGIENPEEALKALETVKNYADKELVEAGKVEEIKAAAAKATEDKLAAALKAKDEEYAPVLKERDHLKASLDKELIGGNFARSSYVTENVAIPVPFLEARYSANFKVEDGQLAAYDGQGNKIYSTSRPGEPAGFDEAIQSLIESDPNKDHILKGRQQSGSGARSGADGGGNSRQMPRAEFDRIAQTDPARAQKVVQDGFEIVD